MTTLAIIAVVLLLVFMFISITNKHNEEISDEDAMDAALYQSMHNVSGGSIKEYAILYRAQVAREKKAEKFRNQQYVQELTKEFLEDSQEYFDEQQSIFNKTYHAYLKTVQWQELKFAVYERDNYRCKQCKKSLAKMNGNVHHTTYINVYDESIDDLELVCKDCHQLIHSYYKHFFPLRKTFPLLSTQQYIEAIELSNTYIDKK